MGENDPLEQFRGQAACPVCGCLDRKGMYRCSECGTFHAGSIMEEREAPPMPPPEEREQSTIDPSVYSLGPNATIPEETFDESEDLRSWDGGSTDFSFEEDDSSPHTPKQVAGIPEPEIVSDDD
jgi:hypothetical protein